MNSRGDCSIPDCLNQFKEACLSNSSLKLSQLIVDLFSSDMDKSDPSYFMVYFRFEYLNAHDELGYSNPYIY